VGLAHPGPEAQGLIDKRLIAKAGVPRGAPIDLCCETRQMPITKPDHFTVLTQDATATAEFYEYTLGLQPGPRPNFAVPGIWLYSGDDPILHLVERDKIPNDAGVLDHMAFRGTDLAGFIGRLKVRGISYELRRVPEGGPSAGVWQLFFRDPNGARVEIDLAAGETVPPQV